MAQKPYGSRTVRLRCVKVALCPPGPIIMGASSYPAGRPPEFLRSYVKWGLQNHPRRPQVSRRWDQNHHRHGEAAADRRFCIPRQRGRCGAKRPSCRSTECDKVKDSCGHGLSATFLDMITLLPEFSNALGPISPQRAMLCRAGTGRTIGEGN